MCEVYNIFLYSHCKQRTFSGSKFVLFLPSLKKTYLQCINLWLCVGFLYISCQTCTKVCIHIKKQKTLFTFVLKYTSVGCFNCLMLVSFIHSLINSFQSFVFHAAPNDATCNHLISEQKVIISDLGSIFMSI